MWFARYHQQIIIISVTKIQNIKYLQQEFLFHIELHLKLFVLRFGKYCIIELYAIGVKLFGMKTLWENGVMMGNRKYIIFSWETRKRERRKEERNDK